MLKIDHAINYTGILKRNKFIDYIERFLLKGATIKDRAIPKFDTVWFVFKTTEDRY